MNNVFFMGDDSVPKPLKKASCKDEFIEQHKALENNYNLLPGDQITPEEPRRWFLVKREMPVPDPNTGNDRWSVDFLFVDQDGTPTFVECKRHKDTRTRREVVAQVLEYAANGHYYWEKTTLLTYSKNTCSKLQINFEVALANLVNEDEVNSDEFFENVEFKLKEGNLRLIFFVEEAPMELKSIVEFLNNQMIRTEVLIVECKMFETDEGKIIVPSLFGYTEEARFIKQDVKTTPSKSTRKKWDIETFKDHLLSQDSVLKKDGIIAFINKTKNTKTKIKFGSGSVHGSLGVFFPEIVPRLPFYVRTDGVLCLQFGCLKGSDLADDFNKQMQEAAKKMGLKIPDNLENAYPEYPSEAWVDKHDHLIELLEKFIETI